MWLCTTCLTLKQKHTPRDGLFGSTFYSLQTQKAEHSICLLKTRVETYCSGLCQMFPCNDLIRASSVPLYFAESPQYSASGTSLPRGACQYITWQYFAYKFFVWQSHTQVWLNESPEESKTKNQTKNSLSPLSKHA